ncbi:MAG TPA: nucleotidyltransferase domain-containing protein [Thermoanaerobacter sp.]|nr:nucleotidyltransferase domain-containing protein [Thermoanaerobacter sp.]HAA80281.1 nucleotidyltransferase domain-containing protein [Thermoanaerobacter sp.]
MVTFIDRKTVEKIAREYAGLVKKEMNIEKAYLYGSYAKGNYTSESDIDIAVIM